MNKDAIKAALNRIGQGLSAGDTVVVSEAWATPATIFLDAGAIVATTAGQLTEVFKRAIQANRKRDLVATRPEIEQMDELNPKLTAVRVRWPAFDRDGMERASERTFYVFEEGDDGRARVRFSAGVAG